MSMQLLILRCGAACGTAAVFCAASRAAEEAPLRAAVKAEPIRAEYNSQLLGNLDIPVGKSITLPGRSIRTRVAGGTLKVDLEGRGRYTAAREGQVLAVTLKRTGVRRSLRYFMKVRKLGGRWTYRCTTQLTVKLGKDEVAVVDANGNGLFNEPRVDGIVWKGYTWLWPLPAKDEGWCTPGMELTGLEFGPWGEDFKVRGRPLTTTVAATLDILRGTNIERCKVGIPPRPEDRKLSADLQKHCEYMKINRSFGHKENPEKPGYTKEGDWAGRCSLIGIRKYPINMAVGMIETYFHRRSMLRPGTRAFGVGMAGRYGGINGSGNLDKEYRHQWPILVPVPGQEGMSTLFRTEFPDPAPGDKAIGYPITAYFGTKDLKLESYRLTTVKNGNPGDPVECYTYDPKSGQYARRAYYHQVVCIIPKDPLTENTEYEVMLKVSADGKPWQKTWRFTTGISWRKARRW